MYWFQRWFEKVTEAVRSESSTIQNAIHQQKESIAKDIETRNEKQAEIGTIIARAIYTASDTVPDYEKTQRQKEHSLQWGMFGVTLFAAFAAAGAAWGAFYYAGIANKQLCEMRRTNDLTDKALKKSDDALSQTLSKMQGQIDVAQSALKQSRAQIRLENRAWISPVTANMEVQKKDAYDQALFPPTYIVRVTYGNTGRTPAIHVRAVINQAGNANLIPDKDVPARRPKKYGLTIFPSDGPRSIVIAFPQEAKVGIPRGRPFYVFGTVWYDDTFSTSHWTQYCFVAVDRIEFEACSKHYDSDDTK